MSDIRRLPPVDPAITRGDYNVRLINPEAQNVRGMLWRGAPWGLADNLSNTREMDYILFGPNIGIYRQRNLSPHLLSSGRTDELAHQPGGRKWRKEHYTRKAKLEEIKENARRQKWEKAYPGAPEHHLENLEKQRKERKQRERNTRRAAARKSTNSKK